MNVILDFTVIPIGVGISLSKYVAVCQKILDERQIKYQLHANGTNVEGEWGEVFAAIKECHETIHEMGAPRISTSIKVGTRNDKSQSLDDKIKSVEEKL